MSHKHENKTDPDQHKGKKPLTFPIREDGNIEGLCNILSTDYGQALVINEWLDGELTAFIEEDNDND